MATALQGSISSGRHRRVINRTRPTPAFSSEALGIFHDSTGQPHTGSKHPESPAVHNTPHPRVVGNIAACLQTWRGSSSLRRPSVKVETELFSMTVFEPGCTCESAGELFKNSGVRPLPRDCHSIKQEWSPGMIVFQAPR